MGFQFAEDMISYAVEGIVAPMHPTRRQRADGHLPKTIKRNRLKVKRTAGGCIIAMMVTLVAVDLLFVSLRAEESLMDGMPVIGRIRAKGVGTHTSKMWMLGCECLDRDYAEFLKYRDYILPLGIGRIRLQAGWARCERERGKFDFG